MRGRGNGWGVVQSVMRGSTGQRGSRRPVRFLLATSSVAALVVGAPFVDITRVANAAPVCTLAASGPSGPVSNAGTINCISVNNAAVTGNVSNTGTLTSATTGIAVTNSTITGAIIDTGTIAGGITLDSKSVINGTATGISVTGPTFGGGISNAGSITLTTTGPFSVAAINVNGASTFSGGINNSGSLTAQTGIVVQNLTSFTGGITNSHGGVITASNGGIIVSGVTAFSGGITNNGTITVSGAGGFSAAGIALFETKTFTGNIVNTGSLNATTGNRICTCVMSTFAGSLINSRSITAVGTGIIVQSVSTFTGDITNSGTIATTGTSGFTPGAIIVTNVRSFGGSIFNSNGTITVSTGFGISVTNVSTFAGGITNTGSITVANFGYGIYVDETRKFLGGITNGLGSSISAPIGGIVVGSSFGLQTFAGGITNNGAITAGFTGIGVFNIQHFSGNIANTGTITATGGVGIIVCSCNQTFTGDIINSGTITAASTGILLEVATFAGSVSNTGTISGNVGINLVTGGVSVFDAGAITGTGGIAVQFSGSGNTFTLGPGYTTPVGIVAGTGADTFQLGGTGAASFDLSTVGPVYQGFTTFNVVSGTWTVTNTFGQAQPWNVNGGTLAGTGTLSSVNVNAGGTIEPGLPGTAGGALNIAGSLVFANGATDLVNVSPTVASLAKITGTATLAGTLNANGTAGAYTSGMKYTVLTATTGVTGTFGTFAPTGTFGSMMPVVSYDANDVYLTLAPTSLLPHLPPGAPQNVVNVANGITAANLATPVGGTPPLAFQNLFNLTPQQLQSVLTQLSGEAATDASNGGVLLMNEFLELLTSPSGSAGTGGAGPALPFAPEKQDKIPSDVALAYASVLKAPPIVTTPGWNAWAAAFGGGNTTSGDPSVVGSHDVSAHAGGFAAGMDYRVAPDTTLGFALAGGTTTWSLSGAMGGGRSDVFLAGLYGSKRWSDAYLSGALTYASYWTSTSRMINVVGPDTLTASFNAYDFGGRLEGGYRIAAWAPVSFIPYAALQAQAFRTPSYGENGTLAAPDPSALSYAAQTTTVVRSELGSRFDRMFAVSGDTSLDLFGRLAWAHDWQSNASVTATFIGFPAATFVVNGAAPPTNLALATAGAEWRLATGWSFMARFDGEFANRSQTYSGTGRIKYSW